MRQKKRRKKEEKEEKAEEEKAEEEKEEKEKEVEEEEKENEEEDEVEEDSRGRRRGGRKRGRRKGGRKKKKKEDVAFCCRLVAYQRTKVVHGRIPRLFSLASGTERQTNTDPQTEGRADRQTLIEADTDKVRGGGNAG